jgi:tRNA1(Val) A37 N6-methylase TrmN6
MSTLRHGAFTNLYQSYQDDLYLLPNDESEQDRLDLQHHLYRITVDGPLYLAPIPKKTVGKVLDVGCGTGIVGDAQTSLADADYPSGP